MPLNGSEISSTPASSRRARSMSGQLSMFDLLTLAASPNAISSQASADGRSPYVSQGGPTIAPSGPAPARAKPYPAQPEDRTPPPTSGRHGFRSSRQAALEKSLANRFPIKSIGSIASAMTWKPWATKSGRLFCRLSASVKTMRDLGFILLATPTATANQSCASMQKWPGCRGVEVTPEAWCRRMGYPLAWLSLAPSGTRSTQTLPPRSSRQQAT